jgi:tetratricopeptide (TPR) repeat protein
VERNPFSSALHGALGRVHLLDKRPAEAESELLKALELGSSSALDHAALGWALVRMGRFDEALPWAEAAYKHAHEDFGVYCLYCGLRARHGRAAEMGQLFDFLKRSAIQMQKRSPKTYEIEQREQFEFARSEMQAAGYV